MLLSGANVSSKERLRSGVKYLLSNGLSVDRFGSSNFGVHSTSTVAKIGGVDSRGVERRLRRGRVEQHCGSGASAGAGAGAGAVEGGAAVGAEGAGAGEEGAGEAAERERTKRGSDKS